MCWSMMMTNDDDDDDNDMMSGHVYLAFTMCQTLLHYSKDLYIYKLT